MTGRTDVLDLQKSIDRFAYPLTGLIVSWGAPAMDAAELAQDVAVEGRLYQARKILRRGMDELTSWIEVAKAVLQ